MSKNTIGPLQLLFFRNYPDSINMIQSSPAELSSNLEPSWSILCYLEARHAGHAFWSLFCKCGSASVVAQGIHVKDRSSGALHISPR